MLSASQQDKVIRALDGFNIELPSWGFSNTGTRFGKFMQASAATTIEEKFEDAGQVHKVTGCCPSVALHVLWDFPEGIPSIPRVNEAARKSGVKVGAINPNVFQDQIYKYGSLANPDPQIRKAALDHILDSIEIAKATGSRDISLWFTDGSNYPGTQNIRQRKDWFAEGLRAAHGKLGPGMRLLVEYKPFEPAFYHTDIADWGMALILSRAVGPQAKVLVDTGHHYQAQNIEQVVAWLLSEDMLGGFHFNDRRYADDDLTFGSIDPYQVFRIFHEMVFFTWETGKTPLVPYMIDQSHNLKLKAEEMIQTAMISQTLYAKAALVDHKALVGYQMSCALIDAEECVRSAFFADVEPAIREWRKSRGLGEDPLAAFRASGYDQQKAIERGKKNAAAGGSYA